MRVAVCFETGFVIEQMPQVKEEPGKNKGFQPQWQGRHLGQEQEEVGLGEKMMCLVWDMY